MTVELNVAIRRSLELQLEHRNAKEKLRDAPWRERLPSSAMKKTTLSEMPAGNALSRPVTTGPRNGTRNRTVIANAAMVAMTKKVKRHHVTGESPEQLRDPHVEEQPARDPNRTTCPMDRSGVQRHVTSAAA